MSNIHTNIKVLREEARLSQEEFAEKLGVSLETVKLWEKGKLDPTPSQITKMCPVLRIHEEDFLERDILQERNDAGARMKNGATRSDYNWYYGKKSTMAFYISYLVLIPVLMIITYFVVGSFMSNLVDIDSIVSTPEDREIILQGIKGAQIMAMLIVEGFVSAVYAVCYYFKRGVIRFQYWYLFWITPIVTIGTIAGILATPVFYVYAIYKGIIMKGKNR